MRGEGFDRNDHIDWDSFLESSATEHLCADDEIAAHSFVTSAECLAFVRRLRACRFLVTDLALVDQKRGLLSPSNWLDFGSTSLRGVGRVAICRLVGSQDERLFTPPGWTYAGSLSELAALQGEEMFLNRRRH